MTRTNKIVDFTSGNLTLEGMLTLPTGTASAPGALICHPHPQYGGDMDNNVVSAAADALEHLDLAVLRFNFRGVNGSEGSFDNGNGEINDVLSALSFLSSHDAVNSDQIFLAGYSFGAFVGLQAAMQSDMVRAVAAISMPLDIYDFGFLSRIAVPILVTCGDRDSFCSLSNLERSYADITAPKEKTVFPGADHFYWGHEPALSRTIQVFAQKHLVHA